MKTKLFLTIIFLLLLFSCRKENNLNQNPEILEIDLSENKVEINLIEINSNSSESHSQSEQSSNFLLVRYVNSKEGLNQRESASAASRRIGTLLHGTRVILYEKSDNQETIDGITDYWYKCRGGGRFNGFYWVFGGYLSTTIPEDTAPFLGYWNTDRGRRYYWEFEPDHTVVLGRKETNSGWIGTWTLTENHFTINMESITMEPEEIPEELIIEFTLTIINRDKIILKYSDGTEEILERNNNVN